MCFIWPSDRITPIPTTSRIAARLIAQYGVKADLIYIDASHLYEDVQADLREYWPLVAPDGVLCGDDWTWADVRRAVEDFAAERALAVHVEHPQWWIAR